jgi:hypothetical protein
MNLATRLIVRTRNRQQDEVREDVKTSWWKNVEGKGV